jgi:hypothetical protein
MLRAASYGCFVVAFGTGVMFWITAARRGCHANLDAITQTVVGLLVFHLCAGGGLVLGLLHTSGGQPNRGAVAANAAVIGAFWMVAWAWPC